MFSVKIEIPEQEFAQFAAETEAGPQADYIINLAMRVMVDSFVRGVVENLEGKAKEYAPVRTGNLRDSIKAEKKGGEWRLVAGAKYSKFVEFGTGIFCIIPGAPRKYIYPKTAEFLVFRGKSGKLVFAKKIKGQKPRLYMNRALQQLDWAVDSAWDTLEIRGIKA